MALLLAVCLVFGAGDESEVAPVPNQDEVLAMIRHHLARWEQPMDHYIRRLAIQAPPRESFFVESTIEVHGSLCKTYHRDTQGVERVDLMNQTHLYSLIKLPTEEKWKLSTGGQLDEELHAKHRTVWYSHAWMRTFFQDLETGPTSKLLDPAVWTVTKVTAMKFGEIPVYRVYAQYEGSSWGQTDRRAGYVDIAPARSWAIVRMNMSRGHPVNTYGTEYTYEYDGEFAGVPKVKRVTSRHWSDTTGTRTYSTPHIVTVVELAEQPSFDTSEFTLAHYGLGPPYRSYFGMVAGVGIGIVALVVLIELLRTRRRKGLTWTVAAE
jgi:hypothetical protein